MGVRKKNMADQLKEARKQMLSLSLLTVLHHQEKCV